MKKIRELTTALTGLPKYFETETDDANWDAFRNHNSGISYRELIEALVDVQHGLCGYCEIALIGNDRQIEHVIPRSDLHCCESRELDVTNMIACCKGGTESVFAPSEKSRDADRFLTPVKDNMSCGQAKGDCNNVEFAEPRKLPALPSITKVLVDGRIVVDEEACRSQGIPAARVRRTIKILNLDARRLRVARKRYWSDLEQETEHIGDTNNPKLMDAWVHAVLMPNQKGRLAPFFTTSRSYFGTLGEIVLAEHPQAWI